MSTCANTDAPDKWDLRYFKLAELWADQCSKDPATRVGAVVVGKDRRHIALGYNGIPPGIKDTKERYSDRQLKYLYVQHAERNVLDNATFSCDGGTLISTMFPCVECTKSLITKGIKRLVSSPPPTPLLNGEPSWRDGVPHSISMLREAGVRITIIYQGDIPDSVKPFTLGHEG